MSTSKSSKPERPTFGVEVEFLIATFRAGGSFQDPHRHLGLPPVLRIPQEHFLFDKGEEYTHSRVKEVLVKCFGSLPPLPRPSTSISQTAPTKTVLDKYQDWTTESDGSILPTANSPYNLVPIEIRSPVQHASPKAFESISVAISAITSKFRCEVNLSCGVHVHVGLGAERMSLEHIRRCASLSYAVEPLLFTLHDPVRKANVYCQSLRDHSYLANDVEEKKLELEHDTNESAHPDFTFLCHRYMGRERRHGEFPMSAREDNADQTHIDAFLETRKPGHFEPFTGPGDSRHTQILPSDVSRELDLRISAARDAQLPPTMTPPAEPPRKRHAPRVRLPPFDLERLLSSARALSTLSAVILDVLLSRTDAGGPGTSVFEATRRIYAQPASCHIAAQLSSHERPAISFQSYQCDRLTSSKTTMRTIEFRMGSGSLDGEWIATWARICVGLFTFALYASPGDFFGVLANCDRAGKEDGVYDVVDLLDDVGLFAEAAYVEKRLMANRGRWGLEFVESGA
ncbi:putative amidoligase enzyme-domain-containing protein [Nemania serpens]|nr:putative amidoligase enzyme-domain-containing protein [Nemania serpens]